MSSCLTGPEAPRARASCTPAESTARRALLGAFVLAATIAACEAIAPQPNPVQADRDAEAPAIDAPALPEATLPPDATPSACPGVPAPGVEPGSPVEYGLGVVHAALAAAGSTACVRVVTAAHPEAAQALAQAGISLDPRPESFAVFASPLGPAAIVVGRDETGAMYGALELAERVGMAGAAALPPAEPFARAPAVPVRAANPFVVLPESGESPWWFHDEAFWRDYLDLLARARMNLLDLHAMYNLKNTIFPNALLWFARSESFPDVGIPLGERLENAGMLRKVAKMARVRGIATGLLSYRSNASVWGDSPPPIAADADLRTYTREAARDLAQRVPELSWLGFRIGEGDHGAKWFADTFVAGMKEAGTSAGVVTRTWLVPKKDILTLVAASPGEVLVESKYNGEHLGAPYPIAGGAMASWGSYGYQDFLQPPAPYAFVFQVRAGGTHRVFRQASFARARRAAATFTLSNARGFTLEPPHAYYPQRDVWRAPADRFSPWSFRRDEILYLLLGRLAYDPATPESVFRHALRARVGTDALWGPVQAASEIVPWIQQAHTCGPDHRDFAPELEWGGTVAYWASPEKAPPQPSGCSGPWHGPFDTWAVAAPWEAADDLVVGRTTTKVHPVEVARIVLDAAASARKAADVAIGGGNAEARDVRRECVALADLGDYFGHKLRGAAALAVYARTGLADYLAAARAETKAAGEALAKLAKDTQHILPFEERLRMVAHGHTTFHWKTYVPTVLPLDPPSIDAVEAKVEASPPPAPPPRLVPSAAAFLAHERGGGPGLGALDVVPPSGAAPSWTVTAQLAAPAPAGATVNLLWKPFSGSTDWKSVPATGAGATWKATVPGTGAGALFAVEVAGKPGQGWRYPDVATATPYVAVTPWQ